MDRGDFFHDCIEDTMQEYAQTAAEQCIQNFDNGLTGFLPPVFVKRAETPGKNPPLSAMFRYCNGGAEREVLYVIDYTVVVKVPSPIVTKLWDDQSALTQCRDMFLEIQSYTKIKQSQMLKDMRMRYAKTSFIYVQDSRGLLVPVIVQEYLDPIHYLHYDIGHSQEIYLERTLPLTDMSRQNVFRNTHTGEVVMIDCLFAGRWRYPDGCS